MVTTRAVAAAPRPLIAIDRRHPRLGFAAAVGVAVGGATSIDGCDCAGSSLGAAGLRSRRRHQCTTIPACDRVNERNTPTAYRGISLEVSPPKPETSIAAKSASAAMPLLKT